MSINQASFYLWVEKFRPDTIDDILLPKKIKTFFRQLVKEKEIPNLLLYSSSPGVGKTTVAKALCHELNSDYLYINASKTGIDVLRTDVEKYAKVKSLSGGKKIVILDEFDGATAALQNALRADIEEYHKSTRFIFTANHITKIIEPLKSRCQLVDFNFTEKVQQEEMMPQIIKRLGAILKLEKITFNEDTVAKIVKSFYPDVRKMLGLLQQYSKQNGNIDNDIFNYESIDEEFYQYILNRQLTKARTYLIERNYNYTELFRLLYDNLIPKLPKEKQPQAILYISEYMYRDAFVVDKEINATACILEIIGIL
jgi:replication factor C small subunit